MTMKYFLFKKHSFFTKDFFKVCRQDLQGKILALPFMSKMAISNTEHIKKLKRRCRGQKTLHNVVIINMLFYTMGKDARINTLTEE